MPRGKNTLFVEPDCEHNGQAKKGCVRPGPGEVSRGCPVAGSLAALLPIKDAAHLVHGTSSCLESGWLEPAGRGHHGGLSGYGFSTHLNDRDMALGGEGKLLKAIGYIAENYKPPAIFVYATCITVLSMEDLDAVCREAEAALSIPVIPVHSPGFSGSSGNMGRRLAGEALMDRVIGQGDEEPGHPATYDINLIGEYEGGEEGADMEALLAKAGIRVLSQITGENVYARVSRAHLAKVNMVVCSRAMITLARRMKDQYDIPYFEGSFYGEREIRFTFRQLAFHFGDAELEKKLYRYIRKEEERLRSELADIRRALKGKSVVLYTDGTESWRYLTLLQELGLKIAAVGTNRNTQEDMSRIRERLEGGTVILNECGDGKILQTFRERRGDLMLVSGRNEYVPLKERIPFLSLARGRHHSYAGYAGVRRLACDILDTLEQPVWKLSSKSAPWER
ncbi:nitrogenase iron-molybdenum cofactor biosynthesis protein NifE [Paenibacillus sp. HN-1]|uniref:nitrogenase component 1 n=1 Tax=Paenibacillus TaxID=44249 RepID=UPI001CA7EDAE|nr:MULTISPECIES: nitrogenase component 1 [Paenibacillus]MBY9079755.1 nitrogenase iron-molybdenum cofactor biosynthesis protein NifE [Paenibacillus sp. CGMCC 1.18879]MBY9084399.1 nitrogenase iron-molybdenum cofactor biosynthesis protein NifE [Paenibacillus sinensis]